jgi:hypothetical protein
MNFIGGSVASPSTQMTLDSSGNVGIGANSPATKLEVNGGLIAGSENRQTHPPTGPVGFKAQWNFTGGDGETDFYNLYAPGTTSFRFYQSTGSGTAQLLYNMRPTSHEFYTGGSERMRINSSGDVGIGTSTPVNNANRATLALQGAWGGQLDIMVGSTVHAQFGTDNFSSGQSCRIQSQDGIVFKAGGNVERMRIDSNGFVGIGTTNPAAYGGRLTIGDPANAFSNNVLLLTRYATCSLIADGVSAANGAQLDVSWATGGQGPLRFTFTNTERMRLTSAGDLGIGTSSPTVRLDVVGNVLAREDNAGGANPVLIRNSNTGNNTTKGSSALFQGTDTVGTVKSIGSIGFFPDDANYIGANLRFLVRSGDAGPTERMRINSSGELLVGTSAGGRAVCFSSSDMWLRMAGPGRTWLIGPATGSAFNIYDESGGTNRFTIDTNGNINAFNSMFLGAGQNNDNKIKVGFSRTGNNYAYVDLIGDTTYTDFGLRLIRNNSGANTTSQLAHRGTGELFITTVDGGNMVFQTASSERFRVEASGAVSFSANSLIVGRNSASTDVNSANDTGSISIRGSTTTVAVMSFHRAGAYAINMGLGTDNVFRIGGWSASSNAFQMDGSGNLTMLGNVTAYSDARMKKDVVTIDNALDLVGKMRGVKYIRKDTGKAGVGVIAQEMLEVMPEVVQQGVGADDTLSVAYGNLVGVLIEAVKELTARVAQLEGK